LCPSLRSDWVFLNSRNWVDDLVPFLGSSASLRCLGRGANQLMMMRSNLRLVLAFQANLQPYVSTRDNVESMESLCLSMPRDSVADRKEK
jgi:hypothetical protein